ncbi:MAG: hypothetical protein NVS2B3_11190 [Vulcanimicrobiaceae bacterium]
MPRTHRGAPIGAEYAELAARVAGRLGPSGRKLCLGCESEIGARRRVWCGDRCSDAYWTAATWRGLRAQVAKRDRGVCALCGVDCRALRRAYAALPKPQRAPFARAWNVPPRRRRKTWWDADHALPLAEGGTNALENLRTLCLPCHTRQTKALAARLARRRRQRRDVPALLEGARRLLDAL